MGIDPGDQVFQEHGASRCWPLPSDSAEAVLSRPAVDAGAAVDVPVVAPSATAGAGPGLRSRPNTGHGPRSRSGLGRSPRRAALPPGAGPAGDPAGVPMPAFDEGRAAALACQEMRAHRHPHECPATPADDANAVTDPVTT